MCLGEIEEMLVHNGYSLTQFAGMPIPKDDIIQEGQNKLILEELSYDVADMQLEHDRLYRGLTDRKSVV